MDPDKQDALQRTENSIYRTAFKLRSVQTLCQLDLVHSSLIRHVLLRQCFWEARESPFSVQQLLQTLQELFRRVSVENPGQVHPRASELTLSLLTALYDSTRTSFVKLTPAAAALIALSGDSPLTKYRALFQLYAGSYRGANDSGARMTRRVLRNLLVDLQQIPTVVGESRVPSSVESAVRSCFQGVLSPAIKEEKFLSWLQAEPPILQWLPTCHRLSATETVTRPARCGICRDFPITGLRYHCLKCLNFDICQVCFLSGLHTKAHPVTEPRVQVSAKEGTKLVLRPLRHNLIPGRWRRPWLLDRVNPKDVAEQAQARLLNKRLNRCKDKLQAICASQEEKGCRFETKIRELTTIQHSLWAKLQQMGQDLQAVLQPLHPSPSSSQNMVSKGDHGNGERFWKEGDSSQIKNAAEDASEQEPLPAPIVTDRSQAHTQRALPHAGSPEAVLQPRSMRSTRAQSQAQKTSKGIFSSLPGSQKGLLWDAPQIAPTEMNRPALAPVERKETANTQEGKDELEEDKLQELLSKLTDAFTLDTPSEPQSSGHTELYRGAERVRGAFSALLDHVTLPNLK
nr:PREDICTED: dystrotelin [Equus przewalskii]